MNTDAFFYRMALGGIVTSYLSYGRELPPEVFELLCDNRHEARRAYEQHLEKTLELKSQIDAIRMRYDKTSWN